MGRAILLLLFGVLLVAIPIHEFCTTPSLQEIAQESAYIASWPAVTGQLDVVHLVEDRSTVKGTTWYLAEVEYRYQVDGKEYKGERLSLRRYDRSPYHQPYWSELEKNMGRFISGARYVKKESVDPGFAANSRTSYYLFNKQVAVHYDPQRPESSILDTFDYDPPSLLNSLLFSMAFAIPGGLFIVIGYFLGRQAAVRRSAGESPPWDVTPPPSGNNRRSQGRGRDTAPQRPPERPQEESGPSAEESASRTLTEKHPRPEEEIIPDIDRTGCACSRLPTRYRDGFPTEWDCTQARRRLNAELDAGNMRRIKDPDPDTPFFNDYFECIHCGTRWKLSHPDQAYRGGLQKVGDKMPGGQAEPP